MRLLILRSHYPPRRSPKSAHTLLLCEELAARGIEVDLLTSGLLPDFPASSRPENSSAAKLTRFSTRSPPTHPEPHSARAQDSRSRPRQDAAPLIAPGRQCQIDARRASCYLAR